MATQLQIRRGTSAQVAAFTGAEGEVVVNTTNDSVHVNDGSTAGGFEMARADLNNVSDTSLNAALTGNTVSALTITTLTLGATAITATGTELNLLDGVTATTAELNILDGVTSTTAELNILDGVTATTAELNFVDGVTSAIQTQLDAKAPLASPTFTGTVTADGLTVDTTTLVVDATNNRVGIGTSSPVSELDIAGTTPTLTIKDTQNKSWTSSDTTLGELAFRTSDASGIGAHNVAFVRAVNEVTSSSTPSGALSFGISSSNANAAEAMRIDSSGRLGIGTSSPARTLDIEAPAAAVEINSTAGGANLFLTSTTGGNLSRIRWNSAAGSFAIRDDSNSADRVVVDSAGRVGINSSSPTRTLDVRSGTTDIVANFESSDSGAFIALQDSATSSGTAVMIGANGDDLRFDAGDLERMRVTSAGRLGLGTSSPASNLEISDSTQSTGATFSITNSHDGLWTSGDKIGSIDFRINDGSATQKVRAKVHAEGRTTGTYPADSDLVFSTADNNTLSEAMRITSAGSVGIGTTSPGRKFTVQGGSGDTLPVRIIGGSGTTTSGLEFQDPSTTADYKVQVGSVGDNLYLRAGGAERMRITSSGNVLVGSTSNALGNTGFKINPIGFARIERSGTGANTHLAFANGNGDVGSVTTGGSTTYFNTSSDQRLKENIADADDAGSKVDAIQVRKFDWIADGSHQDYGMIAQELQSVAPEAVSTPEDPEEMMGVDYSKLVPMLVKEIQSLRARVAQLENN